MIAEAIYGILSSDTGVTDLVDMKIYPDIAPQTVTVPYVVFTQIAADPSDTKDGASTVDIVALQVDIYSGVFGTTQDIARAVRAALDRWSGTSNGQKIQSIRFVSQTSEPYDPEFDIFWLSQDYSVRFEP
jgi:Protein of unknown function (DUF3168).